MHAHAVRLDAFGDHDGAPLDASAPLGGGPVALGPVEVTVSGDGDRFRWSVSNPGDAPVHLRSVRLVFRLEGAGTPLRVFRHGYQSWSTSGVATLGVDLDPSAVGRVPRLVRGMHAADEEVATDPHELRSELVTVLADGGPEHLLVGFDGGHTHDGTLRVRRVGDHVELAAEAFLGGVRLGPGETRPLHGIVTATGPDHSALLEDWAAAFGAAAGARVDQPYQVGWCSWYHYFAGITQDALEANLARAADWPFDVFQLDDGFQPTIGDWTRTNDRFPSDLDQLAAAIAAAGRRPGLWLAPFLARPDARMAVDHPDWIARYRDGRSPLVGMLNPTWGGETLTLDTSNPEVLDHLERVARYLVGSGFTYLKLDFTYAPSLGGVYHDPGMTPAERVRAGFAAIRRGAGDDAFVLGCGAPLGAVVGLVDGNRIGADVAPRWHLGDDQWKWSGYDRGEPATVNAFHSTLARSFLHRRLWLNDPDCLMLRATDTELTPGQARTWAHAVGVSGGMALVSDDLALVDGNGRALLDEVLELGRAADDEARTGRPARCTDLLDQDRPGTLTAAGATLVADARTGEGTLSRA